jgi:fructose-1,6-bisphosphatase/inositol monophosphatase family enzyme
MPCHCEQEHYLRQAVSIAKEAGTLVKAAFNISNKKLDFKSDKNDLVTETDKQVENLIFTKLKGLFPSHKYTK